MTDMERKVDLLYRLAVGPHYISNSGTFTLIQQGRGELFHHSPTGRDFRAGAVVRNPAGNFGKLMNDGTWSWEVDILEEI